MRTGSCRVRSLVRVIFPATLLLAAAAARAHAQVPARNFDELGLKVKAGDTVYVTGDSDDSEQEARILELSTSSLVVSIGGVRRELLESDVKRIRQRLPDSRKNGALIGFLVGAAGSTAGAKALESPPGACSGGCVAANILIGGGLGALVGLGIDALIQGRKDIYVGNGTQSARELTRPVVHSKAMGLSVSIRF